MAWLAVDNKTYTECVFQCKPERASNFWYDAAGGSCIELPKGSIKKLIGRYLTWEDDPVELK